MTNLVYFPYISRYAYFLSIYIFMPDLGFRHAFAMSSAPASLIFKIWKTAVLGLHNSSFEFMIFHAVFMENRGPGSRKPIFLIQSDINIGSSLRLPN